MWASTAQLPLAARLLYHFTVQNSIPKRLFVTYLGQQSRRLLGFRIFKVPSVHASARMAHLTASVFRVTTSCLPRRLAYVTVQFGAQFSATVDILTQAMGSGVTLIHSKRRRSIVQQNNNISGDQQQEGQHSG